MAKKSRFFLFIILAVTHMQGVAQVLSQGYPIQPVPFTDVKVADGFWSRRLEVNRTVSLPHVFQQCEETGRIKNFEVADSILAGIISEGRFCTRYGFDDSDVFKAIEGAAYVLQSEYDVELDQNLDRLIEKIGRAQEEDGYLYTMRTIDAKASWAEERWVNARTQHSHELYNVGHLYEAAVAHYHATGKKTLLNIALESADLLVRTFGEQKIRTVPGHQETEIGLVKLYLVTGKKEYLDLARFFLDERGTGQSYNQDHLPAMEQTEAVGHAVRAAYMYTAMADVATLTGDERYVVALDRIWQDVVGKKLYVTGGVGAAGDIEGFGEAYDLPNVSAYCETCAAIAMILWNHRMFLLHGDAKYMDIVERTLYNGFLSGVSMDGDRFFYVNSLESYGGAARSPWFRCACCPPNILRFVPTLGGYAYAQKHDALYINLFLAGEASIQLESQRVNVTQRSRYPWDGTISMTIDPEESGEFTVLLRIPGWARNAPVPGDLYRYLEERGGKVALKVNGEIPEYTVEQGFAKITRSWEKGDRIELDLPMAVRRIVAHQNVEDDRGKLAIERGPIVYCLEGADNREGKVLNIVIPDSSELTSLYRLDLPGGLQVVRGHAYSVRRTLAGETAVDGPEEFVAIPYYAWAHRGLHQMAVWVARETGAAKPRPAKKGNQ